MKVKKLFIELMISILLGISLYLILRHYNEELYLMIGIFGLFVYMTYRVVTAWKSSD
ncbi:hypothetical protein [Haloplasma contractile]|uniref:hypothetical protein n=1 Tax=Haloplasma contractile TaxID=471825 RepID=UPI00129A85EC|nr:hypothetical protein [Haloplasma contractile]